MDESRLKSQRKQIRDWIESWRIKGAMVDGPRFMPCDVVGRSATCQSHRIRQVETELAILEANLTDAGAPIYVVCSWMSGGTMPKVCEQLIALKPSPTP